MFDLEREVDAWTTKAFAGSCRARAATRAELQDHLHCEIERLAGEGKSPEEAFRIATAKLEGTAALVATGGRNPALGRARIAHAILWAALFLASALVLSKSAAADRFSVLLIVVLIPAWFASDQLLARVLRDSRGR